MKGAQYYSDPSLSSHIESIGNEKTSQPRLKYSLACIANTLQYNNSNRHHNIQYLQKANIFQTIVKLISNNQDQKILQQSLNILNIFLNEGNDLTINQQHEIMHSLTYIKGQNQADKGIISDKLVQEILLLTYKLKTKNDLSQFIATLIVQKMSASQAKMFLKQLRKQQLKNIGVSELIKIGIKFKTNVLLMSQILNLLYQKTFSKREQNDMTKIALFLPKILEQNIQEQLISYQCLLLYKIIEGGIKIDPITQKYLKSLLKYNKELFLPLKRQFINTDIQFIKILQYGSQFQIYHLLVVDYLIKNGFVQHQQWRKALQFNDSKKNIKLKQICLRVTSKYRCGKFKCQISQTEQSQFLKLMPIQSLKHFNSIIQKLQQQPNMTNCIFVIKNLAFLSKIPQLVLSIHRIALKNKSFHLVQQIQKIVVLEYNQNFITKVKHKIVLKGQLYFIWIPLLVKRQQLLNDMQNQLSQIMNYQSIDIQDKFYILGCLIQNKLQQPLIKFLLFLNRQIQSISFNQNDQKSIQAAETILSEMKFYLRKLHYIFQNKQIVNYFVEKLQFHLQRTIQLLFSKIVQVNKSDKITTVLFELQKYDFYGQNWRQPYRWILTAIENINQQSPIYVLDCLQIFQMSIENIKQKQIPQMVKQRFFKAIDRNWSKFQSQHLFAIQRIVQILWPDNDIPFQNLIIDLPLIPQLMQAQKQFNKRKQYFFQCQHPTSQFLVRLTQNHFFGFINQQDFIRCLLQLSDKKYSQIKRFTQKNVILMMNFIIWVYQYSQQDMDSRMNDMILAFLGYKGQGSNQISSYNIRKKCIQIVAIVGHSINLLKLPIKQLLQTYIGQTQVMKNINEILKVIIDSKPSFIQNLNLSQIIQSVIISLITCQNIDLIQQYINFVQSICYIEGSKYSVQLEQSIDYFYQVLKIQRKVIQLYRKDLINFVIELLIHYQYKINQELIWFLMSKYFIQQDIQTKLLQMLQNNRKTQLQQNKNIQKKLQYSNQKLLIRLIMHHNKNDQIISKVQSYLNECQKQQKQISIKQNIKNNIQPQKDFTTNFRQKKFIRCQQLLNEIRNPLQIFLSVEQIKYLIVDNELKNLHNLLNFIFDNPNTRNQIIKVPQIYYTFQCYDKIRQINQLFNWNYESDKLKVIDFNQNYGQFTYQQNVYENIVSETVRSMLNKNNVENKILNMMNLLKSKIQKIQILSFYSKFIVQQQQKTLIKNLLKKCQLEQGVQLMKINIPLRINLNSSSVPSIQFLLYHIYVNLSNLNSQQNNDSQNYLTNLIINNLNENQFQRNKQLIGQFFYRISEIKINCNKILKTIMFITNKYLQIYQNKTQFSKNQLLNILSTLLFMWRNNQNYKIGISSKILQNIHNKVNQSEIFLKAYNYLIQKAQKIQKIQQINKNQQQNKTIKQKQKNQHIVFAKQITKQQQQIQQDKQANQAYKKSKQLDQYTSLNPNKFIKINKQKQVQKSKKQQQVKFEQQQQQNLIHPKQVNFDESKFYDNPNVQVSPTKNVTQNQRKQILENIKSRQKQQLSITTLKQHAKFISSLLEYPQISKSQLDELMKSIDVLNQTVQQHYYYVKKICQLEVTFKLIKLFKRKQIIIPLNLSQYKQLFQKKLLKLHHSMAYKKQKKTIIFDDELSIQFFKLILNRSINTRIHRQQNSIIIDIIIYCMKNIQIYFKQGLISMLIQMCKSGLHTKQILAFLCKIQLNKHIINQIYNRGMLNKLIQTLKQPTISIQLLNLWIKLAAKMCINQSIQLKYLQKNIHTLVWNKYQQSKINQLQFKINVAYFFALLTKKNMKTAQFIIQNQILDKLLLSLQNQNCQQLYLLFYNVTLQNPTVLSYCFRIKYHLHLIQKLTQYPDKIKSKYFYKSLGKIMTQKSYQQLFFKQRIVEKLTKAYQIKAQPSIYECLLDFIITLQNDKQFQQIKKQDFWKCLGIFEYKLSSQATYAYILQIFLVMIKKGRIKQFNTAQIRGKVTLKAQYSINLDGKQLALRFIIGLSLKTKQCYLTQRCIRLLSSIVGFKATQNQLSIIQDVLQTDGMIDNYQFLGFCAEYQITSIICNKFKQFNEDQTISALKILNVFGKQQRNIQIIRDKIFIAVLQMLKNNNPKQLSGNKYQILLLSYKLILLITKYRQNYQTIQKMQMGSFMVQILDKLLLMQPNRNKILLEQYVNIIDMCRKNELIPLLQIQQIVRKLGNNQYQKQIRTITQLKQSLQGSVQTQTTQIISKLIEGITVKMYKNDGSNSQLILFLTDDKIQLNCVIEKGQPVKQKWRLPLNQIIQIQAYLGNQQYQKSAFYKASGIFTSAPDRRLCLTLKSKNNQFNILFDAKQTKQKWRKYFQFAIQNSKKILKQFI